MAKAALSGSDGADVQGPSGTLTPTGTLRRVLTEKPLDVSL